MNRLRTLFFVFMLSGFSGLIYESIWSRYLGLFLGHAAYAQTLVLSIFMGGMALGAWWCSRRSSHWPNLLRGYAIVEGVIGLCALFFHELFSLWLTAFFEFLLPHVNSAALVTTLKWLAAALLILPQSILLGMTFPLMSGGILREFPERRGRTLAMLYFCNSLGGVAGVLASGFVLIGWVGLPGTVRISGLINILLAVYVWRIAAPRQTADFNAQVSSPVTGIANGRTATLLLLALLTGTASFIYEIGWIRMLSMVLGSSSHSFELMLSAFILGLALGGFWIRNRIDRIGDPVTFLALVQLFMGTFAVATISVYGSTFSLMRWTLNTLPKTDYGYLLYSLSNHGIALLIMLPATFCAGMTLPLITHILLRQGVGERSIGLVYSLNTLGAILGIVLAVHVGMPILGLKNLIVSGAVIDIGLGLALLAFFRTALYPRALGASTLAVLVVTAHLLWAEFDAYKMASGVFRRAQRVLDVGAGDLIVSHFDGKTASITTVWEGTTITIRTNGKVDASVNRDSSGKPTHDEPTMVLSGALPILIHPKARVAANIGLGSGLTSQTLLLSPYLERLDTIEIEKGMVDAATNIRPRNELVFTDSRSTIHIDDAKTFFSSHREGYDIIVSEPSNPWVSGVAGLFSLEFYDLVSRKLNPGGVFLQWLQVYEIDVPLVVTVLKALSPRFADFRVYAVASDLLIVARNHAITAPDPGLFRGNAGFSGFLKELDRVGIASAEDLEARRIGSKKVLDPWLEWSEIPPNSDYYPRLDTAAERARFKNQNARELYFLRQVPLPLIEMVEGTKSPEEWADLTPDVSSFAVLRILLARRIADELRGNDHIRPGVTKRVENEARELIHRCRLARTEAEKKEALFILGASTASHLPISEQGEFWRAVEKLNCAEQVSGEGRQWIEVFNGVATRDSKAIGEAASELLRANHSVLQAQYLSAAFLLANLNRQNEFPASLKDRDFRKAAGGEWKLVIDLLSAHRWRTSIKLPIAPTH